MENQFQNNCFISDSLTQATSKNNQLCPEASSKTNAISYSQNIQCEELNIQHNTVQSHRIPGQIKEQHQENSLSGVLFCEKKDKVYSYNSESIEFSKEVNHTGKNVDMDQNSSLQNINIMKNKELSANCTVEKTNNLNLYQNILLHRKPNSWVYSKPQALYFLLNPILDTLLKQPEAGLFLQPVDGLKIQDYYDIIKNPMDLSTIRRKLTSGQYQNGWEFVDDVWLMFNNAWLYNKKSSRVYKNCSKLSELFSSLIDKPMKLLGYCCGQYYIFEPSYIFCCSRQNCIIQKFAAYWSYDRYQICKRCYSEFQDKVILESTEGTKSINKEKFAVSLNNATKKEIFVECVICKIKCHKICVQYLEDIWKDGYICHLCLKYSWKIRAPNKFTSENLPQSKLGSHIENRVNCFLENSKCNSRVIVRIVYHSKKTFDVKLGAKNKFVKTGIWPNQFPYASKTLLVFQRYEHLDVCFFAMFVQEYDCECPYPNTRRAYISYIDSVHYFTPKNLKTAVYHEIFLGYLEYIKELGFTTAHLWSCPSKKGEDYIFHSHPKDQRNPSIKHLLLWYKKMLDKGIEEGIVKNYKDIYKYAVDSKFKCASELPYFEGDFWPNALENEISKLEGNVESGVCLTIKKTELSQGSEDVDKTANDLNNEIHTTKCNKNKKKIKKPSRNSNPNLTGDPLMDKLFILLYRFREVFLVIQMENVPDLPAVIDPDPFLSSDLMCSREIFLEFCRENDYEFSSLRRARYSTMVFLYELHKEKIATFSCNQCKKTIETGMHCNVCKDFDLCSDCYNHCGHYHEMEILKAKPTSTSYLSFSQHINSPVFLQSLRFMDHHLSLCNNANCSYSNCKKLKCRIEHLYNCNYRRMHCATCLYVLNLLLRHKKRCKTINCLICKRIESFIIASKQKVEKVGINTKDAPAFKEVDNNISLIDKDSCNENIMNYRNTGSSFSLGKEQLKEVNVAKKCKTVSNVSMFATTEGVTEANKNLVDTSSKEEMTVPKYSAANCEIKGLFSNYAIKSDFPSNSSLSSVFSKQMHKIPLNECNPGSRNINKTEEEVINMKNWSTNGQNSLLLSEISISDNTSSDSKSDVIKNSSSYLLFQNVSCSENLNSKIAVTKGNAEEKKASELSETPNSLKTSNYLINPVNTDLWSDSQILNSNINNSFIKNPPVWDLSKSNSKPVDIEQKSLPVLSDNPVTLSLSQSCKTHLMTIDVNSVATKTDLMPCVADSESLPHNSNVMNQMKQAHLPETFNYETDKNSFLYSDTKSHSQNSYSASNIKEPVNFVLGFNQSVSSTNQEFSEISPGMANSFPELISSTCNAGKNIKQDNTSSSTSLIHDLETCHSYQHHLDPNKNIKRVFKMPKNVSCVLPTHIKVGGKTETFINNSSINKHDMKTEFALNKSNFDYQAVGDGPRQITPSKVLNGKQCKTVNFPTLFRNVKILKKRSNNFYSTAGVQVPSSTISDSTVTHGNINISNVFQNASSSDNPTVTEISQPRYIHANNGNLKLINSEEYGKFFCNEDDYQSSYNLLISSSHSNINVQSAVTGDRFKDLRVSEEKYNPVLPNLNLFNDTKNLSDGCEKKISQSFNSNLITPTLTKNAENSSNTFTETPAVVTTVSSNNSSNQQVSVQSHSCNEQLKQTPLFANFPVKYSLNDSKIPSSNDPKVLNNITCTNVKKTEIDSLQTLNFTVSRQNSANNTPKIISCESPASIKQMQFTKISFNTPRTTSVDATTNFKNCNKTNDLLVNPQDFQSGDYSGRTSLLPPNNSHQIRSPNAINDVNFQALSLEYCNQVFNQSCSRMSDKLNTHSLCSSENKLNLKQTSLQDDRMKKMPKPYSLSNIQYLQPALKNNQIDEPKKEKITYSFIKYPPAFQPLKLDTLQHHNCESFARSSRVDLMHNDQNNPNFYAVDGHSESVEDKKSLVMNVNSTDSFENNSALELNMAELTATSIPLMKDSTNFINTSQNKNIDSTKLDQNLYKFPMSTSNFESSFIDLNTTAEPAINISNNSKCHKVTVMYLQSADKMNAKDSTCHYTSNDFTAVHTFPASVIQNTSAPDSSKRLSSRNAISKQDQNRFLSKKHSPNIISKKYSSQSSASAKYTLNTSVYSSHSGNLPCEIKNKPFDSTCLIKNKGIEISYLSSSYPPSVSKEQFKNQELKFVSNHPSKAVNSKNFIACNNPAFSSDQYIYSGINSAHLVDSSNQNILPTSTRNCDYHFSDSSLSKELCDVDNISNYNIDSQTQKSLNSALKTSTVNRNCDVYLMRSMKSPKEMNRRRLQKTPLSPKSSKKCRYDTKYIQNNK